MLKASYETYVQELIKGKTQRQAYLTAFPHSAKWKPETVDKRASELFKRGDVLGRYEELRSKLVKEAENESIVTAKEVLQELKRIGFADIKDYLSFKTAKAVVEHDKETGEPIIDYSQIIEMLDSDDVDGHAIQEVSISAKGVFTFKLYDKLNALEKLGRYLAMYTDKVEHSGNVEIQSKTLDAILKQLEE